MNGKNAENLRHRTARDHVSSIFQNRRPLSAGTPHPNGKLNYTEYKDGSFRGDSNTIKLVMFKDKIVIPQLLQKCVVKWYHAYFFIKDCIKVSDYFPTFILTGIRDAVIKEVTEYDLCQCKKWSIKMGYNNF